MQAAGLRHSALDTVIFGDSRSEQEHSVKPQNSDTYKGAIDQTARRFLPGGTAPWAGGKAAFLMKVDPKEQNYFTVRLWGSETGNNNHLILYCDGKQIGYFHLGDIEIMDSASDLPAYPGRFFYNTSPLPLGLTRGKSQLQCEIRSIGPIWGYGQTFDKYQKPMTQPTRGVYRVYTHIDPCFVPPSDEKQGQAVTNAPTRNQPGEEVIEAVKEHLNRDITKMLGDKRPPNQQQLWFLSRAYHIKWSKAYHNPEVVRKAVEALDQLYVGWLADPKTAQAGPAMYNADWFGFGPAGHAVTLLLDPLHALIEGPIKDGKGARRRAGWSAMFQASRDWHRENRRQYTNQSMINDTYGIYLSNRGVAALEPTKALPEEKALLYLYESIGLKPWLGSERNGLPQKPLGDNYLQVTEKGLTKELGFVGYYGEVIDWMTAMYDATRPKPGQPGDSRIKAQLEKVAHARAPFRYPELDGEGNRAMLAETIIGWRDQGHYPGNVTYAQRPTWDATAVDVTAATLDPFSVAYSQQMLADNQFFCTLESALKQGGLRLLAGLLLAPEGYARIKAQPASTRKLPMTDGQPNFVFSDEEDGCLAIKNGHDRLYASLYWRARNAVNFLARVHYITPAFDRIAVVHERVEFKPSGMEYKRPDWTNMGFANGGLRYPGDWHSAHAAEMLPIAEIPPGILFKPGQENVYAGRGEFYQLHYGSYLIGMNMSKDRVFELQVPAGMGSGRDLVSGTTISASSVKVCPKSTVVLYFGEQRAPSVKPTP